MSADSDRPVRLRLLLPRTVRRLPVDLVLVVGVAVATAGVVLMPALRQSSLAFVAVPFVLFVPGYAVVAVLFPRSLDSGVRNADVPKGARVARTSRVDAIGGVERIVLSVATSVATLTFASLGFEFTPWGIRTVPVVVTLSVFTICTAAVAAYRRKSLPVEERLDTSFKRWVATTRADLFTSDGRTENVLNTLLVVSLLLATVSVAYAVTVPRDGQAFTEFYLLSENETGQLTAADYSTTFAPNRTNSIHVGITNHEHRRMDYVVVPVVQQVTVENGSVKVHEQQELSRIHASVGANESWIRELNVTSDLSADRLRVVVLLYRNDAPRNPSLENAYRALRLLEDAPRNDTASAGADGNFVPPA